MRRALICGLLVMALAPCASARGQTTYVVNPVPGAGDFTTIQDCIDAAVGGDTCVVDPGTYGDPVDFSGKDLTVRSASGRLVTILDGQNSHTVVTFQTGEAAAAVLEGFTITGALGGNRGIACTGSAPTIRDCAIQDNGNLNAGGGIYCAAGASPTLTDCLVSGNKARNDWGSAWGGAIYCNASTITLRRCTVTDNSALSGDVFYSAYGGGIAAEVGSSLIIDGCVISLNESKGPGGGIYTMNSSLEMINSVVFSNTVQTGIYAGGIYCHGVPVVTIINSTFHANEANGLFNMGQGVGLTCWDCSPIVANSILWEDVASSTSPPETELGNEIFVYEGTAYVSYSDVQGGWVGEGNIDQDPLFVSPPSDYGLGAGSPCIDAGSNAVGGLPATDIAGNPRIADGDGDGTAVVDMGAYEFGSSAAWQAASTVASGAAGPRDDSRARAINLLGCLLCCFTAAAVLRRRRH